MMYITSSLDIAEYGGGEPVIQTGETTYYALTADVWAWVIRTTRRLVAKRDAGEITSDQVEEVLRRGREIKARMVPFGEEEMKKAMARRRRLPLSAKSPTADPETADRSRETPHPDGPKGCGAVDDYDEVIQAIIDQIWDNDPFADDPTSNARLRESLIVRLPGCPAVAMDPEAFEGIVAWNRAVRARHAKADAAPARPRRGKPPRRAGTLAADMSEGLGR